MRVGVETREEDSQLGEAVNDWRSPNTAGHVSAGWRWARRKRSPRWRPPFPQRGRRSRRRRGSTLRQRTTRRSHRPRSTRWIWIWWTDRIRGFRPMASSCSIVPIFSPRTRIYGLMVRTLCARMRVRVSYHFTFHQSVKRCARSKLCDRWDAFNLRKEKKKRRGSLTLGNYELIFHCFFSRVSRGIYNDWNMYDMIEYFLLVKRDLHAVIRRWFFFFSFFVVAS